MNELITITTDTAGKNLFETSRQVCERYGSQLDELHTWIINMEQYEKLDHFDHTGQDFLIVKNLYHLQSLLLIASADLSIISSQMYLSKIKLQYLFYNRQLNLTVYEAHTTYSTHKKFLRKLVTESYPQFIEQLEEINTDEKHFVRQFKIKTTVMDIRNKTGGHINIDFKAWYGSVTSIDGEQDSNMAIAFINLFNKILALTNILTGQEHQKFLEYATKANQDLQAQVEKINLFLSQAGRANTKNPQNP